MRVAVGERLQPVGEFVFETDSKRHASMFRYAVEWLEHGRRFAIAPSMPLGEYPFCAAAPRSTPDIAESLRAQAFDQARQLAELYRRMLFMILVSNTDDHQKNHGLLHVGEGRWVLSPAFDINPQPFRRRQLEFGP